MQRRDESDPEIKNEAPATKKWKKHIVIDLTNDEDHPEIIEELRPRRQSVTFAEAPILAPAPALARPAPPALSSSRANSPVASQPLAAAPQAAPAPAPLQGEDSARELDDEEYMPSSPQELTSSRDKIQRRKRVRNAAVDYHERSDEDALMVNKRQHAHDVARLEARIAHYYQHPQFATGFELLNEAVTRKNYKLVYQLALDLYKDLETQVAKTNKLIRRFDEIRQLGKDVIGTEFYAWLLYAIAWHTEKNEYVPEASQSVINAILAMYTESASLGCYFARFNLADILARTEDFQAAISHLLLYVQESPTPALAYDQLGAFYELGWDDVAPNLPEAIKYYRLGHQAGMASCSCNLARLTESKGALTPSESAEVVSLYECSGRGGFADGWFNLGVIHQYGRHGCSVNLVAAEECFRHACALNSMDCTNPAALAEIILFHENALTPERNREAIDNLDIAITLGSHEACYSKGMLYRNGNRYTPKDMMQAISAFERMVALNESDEYTFVDGLICLALLYLDKPNERLEVLNDAINLLIKAERLSKEYHDWKNPRNNTQIHAAYPFIKSKLIECRVERAGILLSESDNELIAQNKKVKLHQAMSDCKHVVNDCGHVPPTLIETYKTVLVRHIQVSVQCAENPNLSVIEDSDLEDEEEITPAIRMSFINQAQRYLEKLDKIGGYTPEFMLNILPRIVGMLIQLADVENREITWSKRMTFIIQAHRCLEILAKNGGQINEMRSKLSRAAAKLVQAVRLNNLEMSMAHKLEFINLAQQFIEKLEEADGLKVEFMQDVLPLMVEMLVEAAGVDNHAETLNHKMRHINKAQCYLEMMERLGVYKGKALMMQALQRNTSMLVDAASVVNQNDGVDARLDFLSQVQQYLAKLEKISGVTSEFKRDILSRVAALLVDVAKVVASPETRIKMYRQARDYLVQAKALGRVQDTPGRLVTIYGLMAPAYRQWANSTEDQVLKTQCNQKATEYEARARNTK